jgi:serralysin
MYGVDTTTRAGNSTYDLPRLNQVGTFWSCIWDAGGVDLLRGASDRANTIDLRPATLQNAPGGGGYASYASGIHGGFTIAKGALIENATGGRLADKIQGNGGVNVLDGRDGNDSIAGARGNDQLYGGNGVDQLSGGDGIDRVLGGAGADRLHGGGGDDDFVYKDQADSTLANRDSIMDFQRGRDDIDLSAIDARSDLAGNQAFRLDTGGVFAIGEIRQSVVLGNLFVGVNLDNDAEVEMSIRVMGLSSALAATDFLL